MKNNHSGTQTNSIHVGDKIRLARTARKLSGRELAELVGLHYATISLFETGKQSPTVEQYEKIQAALGYRLESDAALAAFSFFLNGAAPSHEGTL